jgi:hypothetical protein
MYFFYVDEEVNLSTLSGDVYYKVTCIAEDSEKEGINESSPTNIVHITGNQSFGKIKDQNKEIFKVSILSRISLIHLIRLQQ